MKLLIQADDYAMTKAVSLGIIEGIKNGVIRNTGMFTNMEWSEECVEWIIPYLNIINLGIDLNISTGKPILPANQLPTLVNQEGVFLTSWESRELDEQFENKNHASMEEVRMEFEAQIQKFITLVGKNPDYIHGHAYSTKEISQIQKELSNKYDIPYTSDICKRVCGFEMDEYRIPWYKKPATVDNQLNSSLSDYILNNKDELLNKDYCLIIGHMGYVDVDLMELSSYHLYRIKDLEGVTCSKVIEWIKDNDISLVRYSEICV